MFITKYGYYEFIVMPFGLTNVNIHGPFEQSVLKLLRQVSSCIYRWHLIYYSTQEQYAQYLRFVLQGLRERQLYIKFSKCKFWLDKVAFLRHVVSIDDISIDPSKIEDV